MEKLIASPVVNVQLLGATVYLKCDYQLPSGSFKYREAAIVREYCRVADLDSIVAVTSGNTGDALREICKDFGVRIFTWGKDTTRTEATTAAFEIYKHMSRARTLWFSGSNHPLKVVAHRVMAHECLKHFQDWETEEIRPVYFQATGSGYGCRAVGDIFQGSTVIRVRPRKNLGVEWCPALADPPACEEDVWYVGSEEIREAFEYLNRDVLFPAPQIGLEASTAYAACKSWLKAGNSTPGPIIVNLTGTLKTEVPW